MFRVDILLLGSSGMVGSRFYDLYKNKHTIHTDISLLGNKIDLRRQDDVKILFNKIKNINKLVIVNCAAKVGGIQSNIENPYSYLLDNLQIQNNLIDASIAYKVYKFINIGSSCIYPKDYTQPLKEEYLLKSDLEPTNEGYSLAKICGLKLCEYANKQFNSTKFVSLMPCNLYGIGDDFDLSHSHVLSALMKKTHLAKIYNEPHVEVWGSGNQKRQFMYVDDMANCIDWSIENLEKTDTFLNVGNSYDVSIKNLIKTIFEVVGYNGKIKFDTTKPEGMKRKMLDVSKMASLGWSPQNSLYYGIMKTYEWYLNRGEL